MAGWIAEGKHGVVCKKSRMGFGERRLSNEIAKIRPYSVSGANMRW